MTAPEALVVIVGLAGVALGIWSTLVPPSQRPRRRHRVHGALAGRRVIDTLGPRRRISTGRRCLTPHQSEPEDGNGLGPQYLSERRHVIVPAKESAPGPRSEGQLTQGTPSCQAGVTSRVRDTHGGIQVLGVTGVVGGVR